MPLLLHLVAGVLLPLFVGSGCAVPASPAEQIARLADERIDEASGIVASRRHPGLFYIHNDSGDGPNVYVVDSAGRTRVTLTLDGATAVDWEDIAVAPGGRPEIPDIVVADIGDNSHRRDTLTLYRFAEPELPEASGAILAVTPTVYRIRYAGGPVDAEALLVDPATGDGYIFTKRRDGEPSDIYRIPAPWNADEIVTLERVGELRIAGRTPFQRFITAADISPDGRRVALRTYVGGWEWRRPAELPPDWRLDQLFEQPPNALALAIEPQGEALTYSHDGRRIITVSEKTPAFLSAVTLEPGDASDPR
jgi:hypothetical protein